MADRDRNKLKVKEEEKILLERPDTICMNDRRLDKFEMVSM